MRHRNDAMRTFAIAASAAIFSLAVMPVSVRAQHVPLAELLPRLVLSDITLQSPPAPPGTPGLPEGFTHVAHFSPLEGNDLNNPVIGIVQGFNGQIATQFATFPLGTSTGGLTYVFDESVGTFRRGSTSFGPMFGERALTIGRRKLSAGLNYQHTSYNRFEGQNLENGSIKFYLRHSDCCTVVLSPDPPGFILTGQPNGTRLNTPFEGDLVEAALSLKATTDTTAVLADYGLTDRWDVGVAVPFVRVRVDANVRARVLRLVTFTNPTVHAFDPSNPDAPRLVRRTGTATGIGDVVLRTKYRFLRTEGGGLAAALDLRTPTGNKDELLGAGGVQAKFLLIASNEHGRFGEHANVGYTTAQGRVGGSFAGLVAAPLPDEINYSGGVEFVATPRLTLIGDFVGRTLRGSGRLDLVSKNFEYASFPGVPPPPISSYGGAPGPACSNERGIPGNTCATISLKEFAPRSGNLTLPEGTAGAKYNLTRNLLISGSVLFPLSNTGLRNRITTAIGVDYAF